MYGENKHFVCVRCADDDAWRLERTHSIGGSDAAAILGISKWSSPTSVWLEKTGQANVTDSKTPSAIMEFGNMMEPIVAEAFKARHPELKVQRANCICRSIERPHCHASLDYEIRDDAGEWGVLEIKTATSEDDWADGVPEYYMCQVQHYLYVTGRAFAWVSVFFRMSCEMRDFFVARDDAAIERIEGACDDFWENVVSKTPPKLVSGTPDESGAMVRAWKSNAGNVVREDPELANMVRTYEALAAQDKAIKHQKRLVTDAICAKIGNAESVTMPSEKKRVRWVRQERTYFDSDGLKRDHPDLYDDYTTTRTTSGGLRITTTK